ncbi:hypothetical protein AnigIFM50267_010859 [Aspergillus niger]|nr:hypothetical protein AnigIFM50267_010859 [Aspergillus niger]
MQYSSVQVASAQSPAAHLPATSAPAMQTTVQPTERTYSSGFFYQKGKYWSTNQVNALNRNVTRDVTPSELLGRYFPTEEKDLQVFSKLQKHFIIPGSEDVTNYDPTNPMWADNSLAQIFHSFSIIMKWREQDTLVPPTIITVMTTLGYRMSAFQHFKITEQYIAYNLPKLNMKGVLRCDGGMYNLNDRLGKFPLVVLSDASNISKTQATNNEISNALLPMAAQYDYGRKRDKYVSFCIMAWDTKYRITRAEASHTYFESLRQGRRTTEELVIKRTRIYDLLGNEDPSPTEEIYRTDYWLRGRNLDREEFLKVFWGMGLFLSDYTRVV